ncbi:hypothetical protein HG535_0G04120 [Zygotorulaspora mrakii]|uniref:tRNA-splicing endonuclease subunit Sen2 n=1 Tax=Zygotorulaspora mrakii TaxID=42260 RepID=A0A7H9B957_ZYGMR|nr:uncharacterized protein HG535_0G04120 [Zygotorulaspora mrakii]QLG74529.1 hypothetical protein HG535_0G04120 [Zygotorulaspora mrakii]
MAKLRPAGERYKYPLPIHPIENLPQLIPHNPISWVHWLYCYYKSFNGLPKRISIKILARKYCHIIVDDPDEMLFLWENGFFGTGQLSRSEPTWKARTIARMGDLCDEVDRGKSNLALEDITDRRRLQRIDFKKKRQQFEDQLLELRRRGGTIEDESKLVAKERESLRSLKDQQLLSFKKQNDTQLRSEDSELIDEKGELVNLESLELTFVEALFLSFAIPVLDVSPYVLIERFLGPIATLEYRNVYPSIKQYVAYHHYRSHGWCVRSGIKFGCDYLLYKRGPPFQHAQFCVKVLDVDETHDYTWYSSLARVAGGAKKTLVLCYVKNTTTEEEILRLLSKKNLTKALSSYEVSELIYRRWVPGKNRD